MAANYTGPAPTDLYDSLKDVVTEGFDADSVVEKGGALLELLIVQDKLVPPATGGAAGGALVVAQHTAQMEAVAAVMEQVLDGPMAGHPKYRRVAICLFPLREDLAGMPLLDRRTAAGREMKGKKLVKAESIRTHHQPKVLRMIANILAHLEAQRRDEPAPPHLQD